MVEKLSGSGSQSLPELLSGPAQPAEAARAAAPAKASRGLAPAPAGETGRAGSLLKGLVRDLAARPPVDQARVAELRLALQSGSLAADPVRIAEAMIASLGAPRVP